MNNLTWNNITLDTYFEIEEIKLDTSIDLFDKIIYLAELLGIRNSDDPYWDEIEYTDLSNEMYIITFCASKPSSETLNIWNTNSITFGQFIDIFENYRKSNWKKMLSVIDDTIDTENITISRFLYYKESFETYYNKLTTTYKVLYPAGESGSLDDIEKTIENETNIKVKNELKKEVSKEKHRTTFNWLLLIQNLCNDDITKYKDVIVMSNIFVHNWMSLNELKKNGQV